MDFGTVHQVDIDEQMRSAYLDYAMSVIISRALPDARDGLKPVHRRILFAMADMGIRSNTAYKKSARIVGEVLGKYHPHGDSAVYDAMARMAQDFSMRYPLVDGQGNFGSIDGDAPAAMRYTEARLHAHAEEILTDIDKDTVDFTDNFDGSLKEPVVLPARLPNLLLNGSSGIAVGMATSIPPHNLRELANATNYLIDHYEKIDEVSVEELMRFVQGPDFPTGGIIVGRDSVHQAYSTGRGRLVVRGQAHIEEMKGNRYQIVITEIPYQVNKTSLIERIAELARGGRLDAITDLRDESDRRGMSIVLELRRGAQPKQVLNQLYKYTPLQSTFSVHLLALVNGEPRLLSLKRALQIYIEHRQVIITRRSSFELEKAKNRAHILDGLLIALANLDDVIKTIRESKDAEIAKERLMSKFNLTDIQAQAILDMQLRRLSALERQKIEDEHREIMARIEYLQDLLAHPQKMLGLIKEDMNAVSEKYGDERRTKIVGETHEELKEEDLITDEPVLITFTRKGYIKRVAARLYRSQGRGGRGVSGQTIREEDEIEFLIPARTLHTVLFFSDRGKVYSEKVYQIPDANRTDRGIPIVNVLSLDTGERITAAVSVPGFEEGSYFTMATLAGRVKRVALADFSSVRPSGLIAISLDEGDELGWVRLTSGKDEIIMVTRAGQALRIPETEIRCMGRPAAGVTGIKLKTGDRLTSMDVIEPEGQLLTVTEHGFGKRSDLDEYPVKGRATGGVATIAQKQTARVGRITSARVVQEEDEVTLISSGGVILRLKVKDISMSGRATRGFKLMDLGDEDVVASVARIQTSDITKTEGDSLPLENGKAETPGEEPAGV
ncbi:MAG TPA: DNA gyrase subunit A [Anaerolineaceae bacterium]|jgi:DNA gyrase subunit A|nr:DNA gyrase subunit A [Anaerolineaceae bacterium]HNS06413.1 DNA gyrase subunit A [Anaerolineaceae bacterium]HNW13824.1 DNA gyrase subunit A [Anaerolineaceae bacterium]HRS73604.1 DNA gyrase subunit A [Anaerolineaceae bacterium]HRT91429.1 DNA gyrase subunit A [Anaerolineaceae bacterium]